MTIKAVVTDAKTRKAIHTHKVLSEVIDTVDGDEIYLVTAGFLQTHGTFKSASRSTAGTTIITSPNGNGSLILSDLIIGTDKVNGASVTVRLTDGTNTINIFSTVVTDAPANLALSMAGRWQGWRDARIELVTVGTVAATVSVGYVKVPVSSPYSEWDSYR